MKPAVQVTVTDDRAYATLGDRFLVAEREADPREGTINLLVNWTTSTRRLTNLCLAHVRSIEPPTT